MAQWALESQAHECFDWNAEHTTFKTFFGTVLKNLTISHKVLDFSFFWKKEK